MGKFEDYWKRMETNTSGTILLNLEPSLTVYMTNLKNKKTAANKMAPIKKEWLRGDTKDTPDARLG